MRSNRHEALRRAGCAMHRLGHGVLMIGEEALEIAVPEHPLRLAGAATSARCLNERNGEHRLRLLARIGENLAGLGKTLATKSRSFCGFYAPAMVSANYRL